MLNFDADLYRSLFSFLDFDVSRGQTEDTRTGSGVAAVAGESSGFFNLVRLTFFLRLIGAFFSKHFHLGFDYLM